MSEGAALIVFSMYSAHALALACLLFVRGSAGFARWALAGVFLIVGYTLMGYELLPVFTTPWSHEALRPLFGLGDALGAAGTGRVLLGLVSVVVGAVLLIAAVVPPRHGPARDALGRFTGEGGQ